MYTIQILRCQLGVGVDVALQLGAEVDAVGEAGLEGVLEVAAAVEAAHLLGGVARQARVEDVEPQRAVALQAPDVFALAQQMGHVSFLLFAALTKSCKSCKFIPPAAVIVVLLRQQNNLQDLRDFCRASGKEFENIFYRIYRDQPRGAAQQAFGAHGVELGEEGVVVAAEVQ